MNVSVVYKCNSCGKWFIMEYVSMSDAKPSSPCTFCSEKADYYFAVNMCENSKFQCKQTDMEQNIGNT